MRIADALESVKCQDSLLIREAKNKGLLRLTKELNNNKELVKKNNKHKKNRKENSSSEYINSNIHLVMCLDTSSSMDITYNALIEASTQSKTPLKNNSPPPFKGDDRLIYIMYELINKFTNIIATEHSCGLITKVYFDTDTLITPTQRFSDFNNDFSHNFLSRGGTSHLNLIQDVGEIIQTVREDPDFNPNNSLKHIVVIFTDGESFTGVDLLEEQLEAVASGLLSCNQKDVEVILIAPEFNGIYPYTDISGGKVSMKDPHLRSIYLEQKQKYKSGLSLGIVGNIVEMLLNFGIKDVVLISDWSNLESTMIDLSQRILSTFSGSPLNIPMNPNLKIILDEIKSL